MASQHLPHSKITDSDFTKPLSILLFFVLFCVGLSYVPSPWWKGNILDISVRWPKEFAAIGLTNKVVHPIEKSGEIGEEDLHGETASTESTQGELLPSSTAIAELNKELEVERAKAKEVALAELERKNQEEQRLNLHQKNKIKAENKELLATLNTQKPEIPLDVPCTLEKDGVCKIYALDNFFAQLRLVALKEAKEPVRISQYGDSLISGDGLTGRIRSRLQRTFGYGGHGYIPPAVPARFMGFQGLRVSSGKEWSIDSISKSKRKRKLGFGGASFLPKGDVSLRIREQDADRHFLRLGVIVDEKNPPEHLKISVKGDGGKDADKILAPSDFTNGVAWIEMEPTSDITISDFGPTKYYGFFAENKGGVVVDNVGMLSARTTSLLAMDPKYWSNQLKARETDLVSFSFGTNSATVSRPSKRWLDNYSQVYQSILSTAINGSTSKGTNSRNCLVLGILTRGFKNEEGEIQERASVKPLAEAQRDAALKSGCAFWDMNQAIDSSGGPAGWYERHPQLIGSDFTHPTRAGYKKLGDLFYDALMYEFAQYLKRES